MIKDVKKHYDITALEFVKRYKCISGVHIKRLEDYHFLRNIDYKDKRVLDIGTGDGRFIFLVAGFVKEGVGLDISEEMIKIANLRIECQKNIKFYVMDATTRIDFKDDYFDIVVSMDAFEIGFEQFLNEIVRILKSGGVLLFSCYNKSILDKPYHLFFSSLNVEKKYDVKKYNARDISRVLERDFSSIKYTTTFFIPPALFTCVYHLLL